MKTKEEPIDVVELGRERLEQLLDRAKAALPEDDFADLGKVVKAYQYLLRLIEKKNITLERLKKIIFGSGSEKSSEVFKEQPEDSSSAPDGTMPEQKCKGHGRNGAAAYTGAEKKKVPHPSLKPGDVCPDCLHGKVYPFTPGSLVRITGQAPIKATVYELQKFRCNGCQRIFQAPLQDVPYTKHDATAGAMIALLKYGMGVPFNRLDHLQQSLGVPLPAGTQWEIVKEAAAMAEPALQELTKQAAQGKVLHNDDTKMRILELIAARKSSEPEKHGRKGCFTTGVVSLHEGRRIALFFTGSNHSGENMAELLKQRAAGLGPPIQMCDALSSNTSAEFEAILANCMAHSRRKYVEAADNFPEECKYLLDTLKEVYRHDAATKQQKMSEDERLAFHQTHSQPHMDAIKSWAEQLLEERKVEPNSGLGEALTYMLKHWQALTLFLRQPGAPIDNNVCERALKRAILHRKNALFYKTANGAHVGDVFMSLIHTAELTDADPLDYLTALLQHSKQVAEHPARWMPWNYQAALDAAEVNRSPAAAGPAP